MSARPVETVAILHATEPNAKNIRSVLRDQCRRSFVERLSVHDDGPIRPSLTVCSVKQDVAVGGLDQLCTVKDKGKVNEVMA